MNAEAGVMAAKRATKAVENFMVKISENERVTTRRAIKPGVTNLDELCECL
jgi:hypothetical protein